MAVTARPARLDDHAHFVRLFPELGVPDAVPTAEHFARHILPCAVVAGDDCDPCGYASWQVYGRAAHVFT